MAWASPFFLSYSKFFVLKSQELMIGRNACPHAHIHQQLALVRASNLGATIARFLVMSTPFQRTPLTLVGRKYQGKKALKERELSREQTKGGLFYLFSDILCFRKEPFYMILLMNIHLYANELDPRGILMTDALVVG